MGQFIRYHCDRLRALRDMKSKDEYKTTLHPRSGRQMFHICQCPSGEQMNASILLDSILINIIMFIVNGTYFSYVQQDLFYNYL